MLLRYVSRPFSLGVRTLSTSSANAATAEVSKKDDYYKTFGSQIDESRPPEWDSARPFEEIPGPKPLPILGNIWRFMPVIGDLNGIRLLDMFVKLQKEHGNIVMFKGIPGKKDRVFLFDPKDIEHMFRNAGNFPVRTVMEIIVHYRTVVRKELFKNVGGLVSVQGEEWFKMRSMVNPILMQPRTFHQYIPKLDQISGQLVENMRHFSKLNENHQMPDDFINELYKWSLESVGTLTLNKHFGCLNLNAPEDSEPKKLVKAVLTMFDHLHHFEVNPAFWKFFSSPMYKKFVKNMDFINEVIMKNIDEALSKPIDESVPEHELSVLHRLGKQDKTIAFTMVVDMLVAGLDTTGKTLASMLYFLARHPDKQTKLREEILRVLPKKNIPVTAEALNQLPYLKAVMKEANRIAPVALGTMRTSVKDIVLGGYQIPKGTDVVIMSLCTSKSPDNYKDPDKYLPERWLRETDDEYSAKNAHSFSSLPFGFGQRSCVGMRFATLELEMALISIIRNFELSWEHRDMEFVAYILYGVNDPLKLTVKELAE